MKIGVASLASTAFAPGLAAAFLLLLVLASSPAGAVGLPPKHKKGCHMKHMMKKGCSSVKVPAKPTKKPSIQPTGFPTRLPTSQPTGFPTLLPTSRPTSLPTTSRPSPSPTRSPTSSPTAECSHLKAPVYAHGSHRYARVVHDKIDWDAARLEAEALTCCGAQGHLVVVDDAAERNFIQAMLNITGQYAWIGLSDFQTEGTYVWVDGTPLSPSVFTPFPYQGTLESADCGYYVNQGSVYYTRDCSDTIVTSLVEFECPQG
jgi:Lectin C-type domain